MRRIIQTTYCLMLVPVLLFALVLPCRAMVQPTVNWVTSMEEFLAQYHQGNPLDSTRVYVSRQPLLCSGEIVLDKTQGNVELTAVAGLRVKAGAKLTLDNPNLLVMGLPPAITVEAGGTLHILNWNPMMSNGDMPTAGMIWVEAGGVLQLADGLELPTDMVVNGEMPPDVNSPPDTIKPPKPEPKPEPEPEPEPITSLWGEVLRVNSGKLNYRMTLPRLSMEEVDTIAIEHSTDGEHWTLRETFVMDEAWGYFTAGPDSLSAIQFGVKNTYIAYVEDTDYQDFYLRLTLEGGRYAGVSNAVRVTMPEGAGPGESVKPPATGDYESNEGNQGGGGQGESDRTGQQEPTPTPSETPTPTPTPVEVPPEEDSSKGEIPGNALAGTTDREEAAANLQQSSTGASYSTMAAFYPGDDTGDAMHPVPLPVQPPPQTDAPHSVAEVEPKEEPIPVTEEKLLTAATEELLPVQQEAEAPVQRDGDRGGQAVLITLILGAGVAAAGTITSWSRSEKRRP